MSTTAIVLEVYYSGSKVDEYMVSVPSLAVVTGNFWPHEAMSFYWKLSKARTFLLHHAACSMVRVHCPAVVVRRAR